MSGELDGLLRAAVRADVPDWLEQLVTERAVARVEGEASSLGAACRRMREGVAGLARDVRWWARGARGLWGRARATVPRLRPVLLGASASTKAD